MTPFQVMRMRKAAAGVDASWSNVKLLCGFEGINGATSFVDESPNARTLTAGGNAQISTAQKKFGAASLLLDGTGDYVSAADSADWDFGAGQFTIEAFIRRSAATANWCIMAQWDNTLTNAAWALYVSANNLYFTYYDTGPALHEIGPFAFTPTVGTWYHVAADRDAAGKFRIYVDGVMVTSFAGTSQIIKGSANELRLGALQGFSYDFPGNLDEVRITKGVARYASDSGYTVPTAAFPRS